MIYAVCAIGLVLACAWLVYACTVAERENEAMRKQLAEMVRPNAPEPDESDPFSNPALVAAYRRGECDGRGEPIVPPTRPSAIANPGFWRCEREPISSVGHVAHFPAELIATTPEEIGRFVRERANRLEDRK